MNESHYSLARCNRVIRDVNGNELSVLGSLDLEVKFKDSKYTFTVLVCDISQDAILGQDFLLKHVQKIDYQKLQVFIGNEILHCWTGGSVAMTCRVTVKEVITLPPGSLKTIHIDIPNADKLSEAAIIEPSLKLMEKQGVSILPGIINSGSNYHQVNVVNFCLQEKQLFPNMNLGSCRSLLENPIDNTMHRCARVETENPCKENNNPPEHLQDLFERSSIYLNDEEGGRLKQLLLKNQDVFSRNKDDIGRAKGITHRIETGDAQPIRTAPRRLPIGKKTIEQQEVKKMLENGIIEPSKSAWSSAIVLVPKKDGSMRFCVDYRKLNEITIKDAYPLPRVDDCLDALTNSKWFSSMDLNSGFWQVGMAEEHKEKTAFSTSLGLFHFTVMPFGLCNSPSTLSRLLEDVLRGLQWEECLLYMDDIIVPGSSFEKTINRLQNVFQRLRDANLKLKPSKCSFFQKSVEFLGHIVSEQGVHTDPKKTEAISNWPVPRSVKELRSFLGLCSYYRKFVLDFAKIARPLHKLCEKKSQFLWNDECQEAFTHLKEALITSPILTYPESGKTFILDTDASDRAMGAVLSQEHDGRERVIAYMSKAMNKYEQNYCVTRKELLAVINALKHFHSYLYGQEVLLRTDNSAVSWMKSLKNPSGQVARWLQELGNYNLTITHRPGRQHRNADALSRNPCKVCCRQGEGTECDTVRVATRGQTRGEQTSLETRKAPVYIDGWEPANIRQKQIEDPNIGPILIAKEENNRPTWQNISTKSSVLKTLWRQWDRLCIISGILYLEWIKEKDSSYLLIVPQSLQKQVLHNYHDIPSAGHLGTEKTLGRIKQGFYWPSMKDTVLNYCKSCDHCAARKQVKKSNHAPLGSYHVGEPMERIAIDILGPLPLTKSGNKYILVMIDCFSKWAEAVALPNLEATTITRAFVENFVCRFGTPLQIHSDQGRNFESAIFQEMCNILQIDKTRSTSYHPQSNGNVERLNRTLGNMLAMYCHNNQHEWDTFLPQVLMAYRASIQSSTGQTPNAMVFGREITLPMKAFIQEPIVKEAVDGMDEENYVSKLKQKLTEIHDLGRRKLKQSIIHQKKHYDIRAKSKSYKEGQAVWLHDTSTKVGVCKKLSYRWKGPYVVLKKIDDLTYMIKRSKNAVAKIHHVDRLLPYNGMKSTKWFKK